MVGIRSISLALLILALLPASAAATPTKQIIIKREPGLNSAERADIRAGADVRFVEALPLPSTEVVAAEPGDVSDAVRDLNADPDVVYAERDRPIRGSGSNDPFYEYLWGLENRGDVEFPFVTEVADADTDAPEAWANSTGTGQTVGVVDSGVDLDHPDLDGQLLGGWDYIGDDDAPEDAEGHGTHVAGTIAAVKDNERGVVGMAPDSRILPLRVLDAAGDGTVSDAISAYHRAATSGALIVNASLSGVGAVRAERDALALHPNVLFVVAAGNSTHDNDDPNVAEYPCAYALANVLCVGASDTADRPAGFSNYGAVSVDLFAPGTDILSTFLDGQYARNDGTSMATPHVAGAAALVMAVAPDLSVSQVKAVLMQSGDDRDELAGLSVTGSRVNADAAVELASVDGDLDGVPNPQDACPVVGSSQLPNGCPDGDGDGVTDGSDNCPAVSNNQSDVDGDGVGDACDGTPRGLDIDGDGKPALDDACPTVFGTLADGCPAPPPPDRDGDGRPDASDACPDEAAATPNGCPIAQIAAVSPRVKKRSATVTVSTTRAATVKLLVQRKKGRTWVRVRSKSLATVGNRATLTVKRLRPGAHRVKVSISSSGGAGAGRTKSFRVR